VELLEEDKPLPDVPYEDHKPNTQYDFDQEGQETEHLAIVAAQLSHHFRRCTTFTNRGSMLRFVPKKKNGRLPDRERVQGYGIYAEDGWDLLNTIVVIVLSQIPFLIFAACWLVLVD
jgi:hypothetical protein